MHKRLILCGVSALVTAACAGSQAEQVKDARMEQTEARADVTEKHVEQAGTAREESLDHAYDTRGQAIAAANQPGEKATEDLNDVAKDRALYKAEAEKRVDKLGVRIDEAAKKLDVLGTRAPTPLKSELKTTTTEHNLLKRDIDKLNQTPTTNWEAVKSEIDSRISALDSRIKDLGSSIEDV